MLAPLRDHFRPKDPKLSPLLGTTKGCYITRLSAYILPDMPGFEESRWIISEDVNVEHLLDVFTSIDKDSEDVWDACTNFINHLHWHKPQLVMLGSKIEALSDNHPSKAKYLNHLSLLFVSVGNWVESKRLLNHSLKLQRERGNDSQVAEILMYLSDTNRGVGLLKEGIHQAEEASEIWGRLGNTAAQIVGLISLAWLLHSDKQFDAAEEVALRVVDFLGTHSLVYQGHSIQSLVCQGHRVLGDVYSISKRVDHFFHAYLGLFMHKHR